ncbi:hypothetical protein CQW23_24952 [Capsicum baccatum]|uniref:NB-ARC domain-containing protein n=1 Tax=Capsicum baccatum TaxID=33114 RepID=A0A2G2VWA7_CAPBA|nr:hypothetical protein CQW23_24952 [Capsicum baccatum]
MSYQGLPDCLRHCFLYFGAFPQDDEILTSKLIRLWIAEGLIQQTEGKSLEDVAVDYLMLLIGRGLIMAEQKSSKDRVKSCRVHDLIREFCLAKAKQENVYRLMDGYGEVSTVDGFDHRGADSNIPVSVTCDHRRLLISSNWWADTSLEVSGPLVRSLVVTGRRSDFPRSHVSSLYHNFKLLRVLDLGSVNVGNDFPVGLENMNLLKYLEVRGEMTSVPSSIGSLQRLETFVTIGLRGEVALPDAIWNLRNLRHLRIDGGASFGAPDYKQEISGKLLSNLRTMSTPILKYREDSEEMLRRLPRLEKLKCICLFQDKRLPRLNLLPQLVSLKLFSYSLALFPDFYWRGLKFPSSLRRLTLSGYRLPWHQTPTIGRQLPNLEVLKLQNNAIEGSDWVIKDGDFPRLNLLKLDTLDLEVWSIVYPFKWFRISPYREPFPSLERLELQKCKKLKKLPAQLKKCKKLKEIKVLRHSLGVQLLSRHSRICILDLTLSLNCPLINDLLYFRNTTMPPRHNIDQIAQADVVRPTHGMRIRNRASTPKPVPTPGVPPVPTIPPRAPQTNVNCPPTAQRDILNAEFRQSIHMLTQLVANQAQRSEDVGSATVTSKATRVGHFIKMNPPKFTGTKVEEDPQKFVDEMEKIFKVMHVDKIEEVELATYQLKDVVNQWYADWEDAKGESAEPTVWGEFVEAFLDRFFPLELR